MLTLKRGQKESLTQLGCCLEATVELSHQAPWTLDYACFGLNAAGKLEDDRYFLFYNQKVSPEGAVRLEDQEPGRVRFQLQLSQLPATIDRLAFTATIDGDGAMNQLQNGVLRLQAGQEEKACFAYNGQDFQAERAIVIGEIYRKNGDWRLSAVGRGFNGGLQALIESFGGEVEQPAPVPASPPRLSVVPPTPAAGPPPPVWDRGSQPPPPLHVVPAALPQDLTARMERLLSLCRGNTEYLIPLYESLFQVVRMLPQAASRLIRTVMMADVSGSMFPLYRAGRVQRVIDKLFPLATLLHDQCSMDFWSFAAKSRQFDAVTPENIRTYSFDVAGGFERWMSMLNYQYNNEPEAMRDLMMIYGSSSRPVWIFFLTDGQLTTDWEVEEILIKTSRFPLFWQFIGVNGQNYGVLEHLDEIDGRYTRNASFFQVGDIDDITDQALYNRLLGALHCWLEELVQKQMLG